MRLVLAATILSSFAAHGVSSESVRIQGSVDVFERVGAALTERFGARYGDVSLAWDAAGSGAVFAALFAGTADLGVSTRAIADQEIELARRLGLELKESALALDGLAVIVHPDNDVPRLTIEQLEALYLGRIVRWLGFGGIDEAIHLLGPPDAAGAQSVFKNLVLGNPGERFARSTDYLRMDDIVERVAFDRGAVGFVSMSRDLSAVRTVPIVGPSGKEFLPDIGGVASGAYPLCHAIWLYRVGAATGELRHFLRFLLLHDGQRVLADAGFVPVSGFHGFERRAGTLGDVPDVMMRRVGFGFRGSRLSRAARTILEDVANGLAATSDGVWIRGHEEPTENGADAELSLARAQSVADFLEQLGIDLSRMVVDSRGAGAPVSSNRTAEGRRVNRRADIWILPEP